MGVREKLSSGNRLIDADALMNIIRQHEYRLATKQGSIDYGMFTLGIQQAVDEQPTVDAVEVVRCKDCKYWQDNNGGYPHDECRWGNGETPDPDDFCSYGKRKEGVDNG